MAHFFSGEEPSEQFCRVYQDKLFCEIFLTYEPVVQEMSFKRYLIWSSQEPLEDRTICAIL